MFLNRFRLLLNAAPGDNGGGGAPASDPAPAAPAAPAQSTGLDFIPEAYRADPSLAKYKNADEFFKGYQNLQEMVGKKEIVQVNGIQIPKEDAAPEEWNSFYNSLGRPESADKYEFSDEVKVHEGLDLAEERKAVAEIAHSLGLTKKQAEGVFKAYADRSNTFFAKSQAQIENTFNDALITAFGKDSKTHFDLAKRGAKALDGGSNINLEEVTNPITLKALAKLGEYVGEDSFEKGGKSSFEDLVKQARELQLSDAYKSGDKETVRQVEDLYKKAYPN
jgi:hypothetical protein